jgi:hypothetical protein
MDASSLRIYRKVVTSAPHKIDDKPDKAAQQQEGCKQNQGSDGLRNHGPRAVDGRTLGKMSTPRQNGEVAVNGGTFAEVEVALENGSIPGDGVPRFDSDRPEGDSNISGYITAQMNRTEGTGHVANGLTLCDRDVGAEAGPIIFAMGVFEKTIRDQKDKKQYG